ncbi:MAG: carbohydrate ABC transporter permease, partial [Candidatus Bathyarchaeota archaeon]|nr:carbohydrate ABC transporter permease [Candidatus Bathyarchaeota archaeon]
MKKKSPILARLAILKKSVQAAFKGRKSTIIVHLIAWAVSLVWLIPFLGVFVTSIRPYAEVQFGWWNFQSFNPTLESFFNAWNNPTQPLVSLSRGMQHSLIVTIPATFIPIFVAALAAYSFARFSFPTKDMLFLLIVLLQTIPQQMVILPVYNLMNTLGLLNTYVGLILLHTAFALPWQILFLRNFFSTLPVEVEEAALIDGASYFKIFYRIVLPMSLPAIASIIALQFLWVWNDFFFALTMMQDP